MRPAPGDWLLVVGARDGEDDRNAEIIETRGYNGGPPYLVRWADSGREELFFPDSDAYLRPWRTRGRPASAGTHEDPSSCCGAEHEEHVGDAPSTTATGAQTAPLPRR